MTAGIKGKRMAVSRQIWGGANLTDDVNRQKHVMGKTGVALSLLLFALKTWAGVRSGSAALLSDALNAFLDVVTYTAAYISIRVQDLSPDENHPFGHRRAEPLAGLLFAVFASVLGATVLKDAASGIFTPQEVNRDVFSFGLVAASIAVKGAMAVWYRKGAKATQSPILRASFIDSRNDVLASTVAIVGFGLGGLVDAAAAIVIGGWIIVSGVRVGIENIGFLMGKAPAPAVQQELLEVAGSVDGVLGVHDLRAHYIGDRIHVELHIEVDRRTTLARAHDIGVDVQRRLEALEIVQDAFIHIDPV